MNRGSENKPGARFSFKKNPKFDLALLNEVESKNPFAFQKSTAVWTDIAETLKNSDLKMKVTARSCQKRTIDLLESYRRDELDSARASGITEEDMDELDKLIVSIAKLEEDKTKNPKVKALYSKKERKEAEAIRDETIKNFEEDFSGDENPVASAATDKAEGSKADGNEESDDSMDLTPKRVRRSTPKNGLIEYLEKKSEKELKVREKEAENKRLELEILRMKTEAEIEDKKRFTDLVIQLASK